MAMKARIDEALQIKEARPDRAPTGSARAEEIEAKIRSFSATLREREDTLRKLEQEKSVLKDDIRM